MSRCNLLATKIQNNLHFSPTLQVFMKRSQKKHRGNTPVLWLVRKAGFPLPDYSFLSAPKSSLMPPMEPSRLVASYGR